VPQARSGGSESGSGAKATPAPRKTKRATAGASAGGTRAARTGTGTGASARGSASTASARSTKSKATAGSPEARLEAAAERLRKLNERIIAAGKQTGETTLSSYEKALKAMASAVERGPGSSDIDWVSHLATTQAKFIRDVTDAWTTAARKVLK
jgi:hypothetical protein